MTFRVKKISEIMEEAEYPGVRVSMETTFDGVRTPLKIDISTGDVITPREVRYSFKLMLEERSNRYRMTKPSLTRLRKALLWKNFGSPIKRIIPMLPIFPGIQLWIL